MPRRKKAGERLAGLMSDGKIMLDGNEYYGVASDGEEIHIGVTGEEDSIEKFLERHPGPEEW